ncbi:amino acid adenylation domain-containing protein [Dendronalium sp. ChiSLP03b]|uniref:amino acid adenylation domain-containing protein n=1 Tax=Dendronalium sp. ChiSLP03b TaxID=3075381 RepID=UPI002AD1E162|nr:amino acid adenylation domain-containing protein [Dendronalium sp. ChiSLP03b]MDZ8206187.1 amino acid adenylation domain-containing protein [Dendronalium sp. ChiSLP03b]
MNINAVKSEYKQSIHLDTLTHPIGDRVLQESNIAQTVHCQNLCIHRMFELQVERSPDTVAVVFENTQLTYRQLNQRANQLAHHLCSLGVGSEVLVGIYLERSLEMIVGLLAILKAGGAYVPLDPTYPSERLAFVLQETQTPVILTTASLLNSLPAHKAQIVCLDSEWEVLAQNSPANLVCEVTSDNLIYIIYTSGSTGQPKGVMIPHRGIYNQLQWRQTTFELTEADKVLQTISLSFDPSVWQIFWPLCFGAQLVLARPGGHQDPTYLVNLIAEQQITVIALVPSMLRVLLEQKGIENCQTLRHITCGGEALPVKLIEDFFSKLNLNNVLHNCYGPTEASIDATFWKCQHDSNYLIAPIGRPIANTQIYILDEDLQPVGVGDLGELHIGGAGLARGYFKRPDLTREKFIPNPFSQEPGARLYKTGDLARYLGDGNIEYVGRLDSQVKIRSFRIELGEIEAVLAQHPAVQQSVVIAKEDVLGDKYLVAYIVVDRDRAAKTDEVRRFLKQRLPDYMMPSTFVILEALPMTPNGKVDRRALPEPAQIRQELEETFVAPRDEMELQLVKIWQKILGVNPIGIRDNFFSLGGHSLVAVRVLAQVEKVFKKNLPVSTLLQNPTIEQLAVILRQSELMNSWSYLVPLQPRGSKPPLFLCQGIGVYQPLITYLDSEQPVYGLLSDDEQGKPVKLNRLEELAFNYIKEIRTLQPEGPYLLGGHSFGGVIAFEMAQQLISQGQKVALLVLLDTFLPGTTKAIPSSERLLFHLNQLLRTGPKYLVENVMEKLSKTYGKFALKHKFFKIKTLEHLVRQAAYYKTVVKYAKHYVPQVYLGRITLFIASEKSVRVEPELGWTKLVAGKLESHEIPGDHFGILKEPNVRLLAEKLQVSIDRGLTSSRQ